MLKRHTSLRLKSTSALTVALLVVLVALLLATPIAAQCPDPDCGGHGTCPDGLFCDAGYRGNTCLLKPPVVHRAGAKVPGLIEGNEFHYYTIEAVKNGDIVTVDPVNAQDILYVVAGVGTPVEIPNDPQQPFEKPFVDTSKYGQPGLQTLKITDPVPWDPLKNDESGNLYVTVGGNRQPNVFVRYFLYFDDGTSPNTILGFDPIIGYVLIAVIVLCLALSLVGGGIGGFFIFKKYKARQSINRRLGKTAAYDLDDYTKSDGGGASAYDDMGGGSGTLGGSGGGGGSYGASSYDAYSAAANGGGSTASASQYGGGSYAGYGSQAGYSQTQGSELARGGSMPAGSAGGYPNQQMQGGGYQNNQYGGSMQSGYGSAYGGGSQAAVW